MLGFIFYWTILIQKKKSREFGFWTQCPNILGNVKMIEKKHSNNINLIMIGHNTKMSGQNEHYPDSYRQSEFSLAQTISNSLQYIIIKITVFVKHYVKRNCVAVKVMTFVDFVKLCNEVTKCYMYEYIK